MMGESGGQGLSKMVDYGGIGGHNPNFWRVIIRSGYFTSKILKNWRISFMSSSHTQGITPVHIMPISKTIIRRKQET